MSPTNRSKSYTEPVEKVSEPPVIRMSSSEAIPFSPFYQQFVKTIPLRTAKLNGSLPLDRVVQKWMKRGVDVIISTVVIIAIFPWLLPMMALLIKLDSKGPVFFFQKRTGKNGRLFTCIKFRSMIVNHECDIRAATEDDERITRLGKFLRHHYLDELPQFFNVWLGDMSLIGPRPHMINDDLKYKKEVAYYDFRCKVKPGITGLAQVLGFGGPINDIQKIKDRVHLDIFYIRHWSLKLDMIVLFRTFFKISGL